jgi:hypothetical protein
VGFFFGTLKLFISLSIRISKQRIESHENTGISKTQNKVPFLSKKGIGFKYQNGVE